MCTKRSYPGITVSALALLIIVGVTACGGSSAAAAPPPTATPSTILQKVTYTTYTDPQGQFTVQYPSTWQTQTSNTTLSGTAVNLTIFTPPAKKTSIGYLVATESGAAGSTPALTLESIPTLLAPYNLTGYTQASGPTPYTDKSGTLWQTAQGTITNAAGKTLSLDAALTTQNNLTYLIIADGPPKTLGGKAKIFYRLLDTFTFGG